MHVKYRNTANLIMISRLKTELISKRTAGAEHKVGSSQFRRLPTYRAPVQP